jgi:hypothetical protein
MYNLVDFKKESEKKEPVKINVKKLAAMVILLSNKRPGSNRYLDNMIFICDLVCFIKTGKTISRTAHHKSALGPYIPQIHKVIFELQSLELLHQLNTVWGGYTNISYHASDKVNMKNVMKCFDKKELQIIETVKDYYNLSKPPVLDLYYTDYKGFIEALPQEEIVFTAKRGDKLVESLKKIKLKKV